MASEFDNNALIEHFRQANSDLALSDLAILIHVRGLGAVSRQLMVSAVDAELQEVREVLEELQTFWIDTGKGNDVAAEWHWCDPDQDCNDGCHRARALWARLEVK